MQETLRGKLEELGPDDILRILTVSRRTGILTLWRQGRKAVLRFRDGLLVGAAAPQAGPLLGELLVRRGVVGQETVDRALELQCREARGVPLGVLLRSRFGVEVRQLEPVVREQLEQIVMPLLGWSRGEYDFVPQTAVETVDAAYLDLLPLLTEHADVRGVEPAPPPAMAEPVRPPASFATVVVVDDDRELGRCLVLGLEGEFTAIALTSAEEALAEIDRLYRDGFRPAVVVDLIMPRRDGKGMLAGLELVRSVRERFPGVALVAVTDFHHAEAAAEVAAAGYPLLTKPRRGTVQGEPFTGYFEEVRTFLRGALSLIS